MLFEDGFYYNNNIKSFLRDNKVIILRNNNVKSFLKDNKISSQRNDGKTLFLKMMVKNRLFWMIKSLF